MRRASFGVMPLAASQVDPAPMIKKTLWIMAFCRLLNTSQSSSVPDGGLCANAFSERAEWRE
jgi:hypothetical protein